MAPELRDPLVSQGWGCDNQRCWCWADLDAEVAVVHQWWLGRPTVEKYQADNFQSLAQPHLLCEDTTPECCLLLLEGTDVLGHNPKKVADETGLPLCISRLNEVAQVVIVGRGDLYDTRAVVHSP